MEELIYVYPGRYTPPTYGHENIGIRSGNAFPEASIICSMNPDKTNDIFKPEESKGLWQAYSLPENVRVVTLDEFMSEKKDNSKVVIVRGIRSYADLRDEEKVMALNKRKFGIDKYFYFISETGMEEISASKARELAANLELETLAQYVAPMIVTKLIERIFGFKNLYLVVGRPGSGKSTFLKMLECEDDANFTINTDEFNGPLKPFLVEAFGTEDLVKIAMERPEELKEAIKVPWMNMLKEALRKAPKDSNVFVEVPYGLQPDKSMFRFLGGKVINFFCNKDGENRRRVMERGTPQHVPFIEAIPDKVESEAIAKKNRLELMNIGTDGNIDSLKRKVQEFAHANGR